MITLNAVKSILTNKVVTHLLVATFAVLLVLVPYSIHTNSVWQNKVNQQLVVISNLEKKHQSLTVEVANLTGKLEMATAETKKANDKAKKLQSTVDVLISQYTEDPTVSTTITIPVTPAEELVIVKTENVKMKNDIGVFISEIKADRELIEAQAKEIALHVKKESTLDEDIKVLEDTIKAQKVLTEDLQSKLATETSNKKFWRTTALTSDAVIITALLILLL